MGVPVMIIGESGSGKSTSLRNFKNNEILVINVSKKLLPFHADFTVKNTDNYKEIVQLIQNTQFKSICIDDSTYLMTNEYMRGAKTTGYQKFTDMALHFWNLIQFVVNSVTPDKIVYFMGHIDRDINGNERFKTVGKMLDSVVTLEGLFTIVLKAQVIDGRYLFSTQTNGQDTVKCPMGLFESNLIQNDLKFVDASIRGFYQL